MKTTITENIIELTDKRFNIAFGDFKLIKSVTEQCRNAVMIVDAQFYYTNPLFFIFIDDVSEHACLYDNYYLVDASKWDEIILLHDIFVVNQNFLDDLPPVNLLDNFSNLLPNLKEYHQEFGLYIIGIKISR